MDVGGPHMSRVVYMDGRAHPKKLIPSYYGHNVGHWEGETLVVDSVGYNEAFWIDREGNPTTEQLHLIERFTRTNMNTLLYEVTVDDPGAYTAPWTGGFYNEWTPKPSCSNTCARRTISRQNCWSGTSSRSTAPVESSRKISVSNVSKRMLHMKTHVMFDRDSARDVRHRSGAGESPPRSPRR